MDRLLEVEVGGGDHLFLEIEGDVLINLENVDKVEMQHASHKQVAIIWMSGAIQAESAIAYRYFKADHGQHIVRAATA